MFFARLFVFDKIIFKSGHAIFAEERRTRSGPEIPEPVNIAARRFALAKSASYDRTESVKKRAARMFGAIHGERKKVPAITNRQTAVKNDRVIAPQPHCAAPSDVRHVF